MRIHLSSSYRASCDTILLGFMGEHKARKIVFSGLEVEGADSCRMRIAYNDGLCYEVDITSGEYLIDGSLLREPGRVKAQIYAVKTTDDSYELVKKSNIFELEIKQSINGEPAPIPPYEQSKELIDKLVESGCIAEQTEVITDTTIREIWEELLS